MFVYYYNYSKILNKVRHASYFNRNMSKVYIKEYIYITALQGLYMNNIYKIGIG